MTKKKPHIDLPRRGGPQRLLPKVSVFVRKPARLTFIVRSPEAQP